MKKINRIFLLILGGAFVVLIGANVYDIPKAFDKKKSSSATELHEGDILFQSTESKQCEAIKIATNSAWSHCGIILKHNGELQVLEAVQPVKWTSINDWIKRSDGKYAAMRLKEDEDLLNENVLAQMRSYGESMAGKDYDIYFNWSDDQLYCSELVWKIFDHCLQLEVGLTKPMREYNLDHPSVKAIMQQRYGNSPPLDEPMISPGVIYESALLEMIIKN